MALDSAVQTDICLVSSCSLCGRPVTSIPGKRPREFCTDCRLFRCYLAAAERHLERIDFGRPDVARVIRSDIIALANRLPVDWERPRDDAGRFVKGGE